jgi:hypothetical protein
MDEQAILNRVEGWARARNGLRAGLGTVALLFGGTLVGRFVGRPLPAEAWYAVPVIVVAGLAWPLSWHRLLLWAGRRLGVGERLAALDVVLAHGSTALQDRLAAEIASARPRLWKLLTGRLDRAVCAVAVAMGIAVAFVAPVRPPAPSPETLPAAVLAPTPAPPDEDPRGETLPTPPEVSLVPPPLHQDVPGYSPYLDLLAMVLGLDEVLGEGLSAAEVAQRLAEEEGLLRRLAEQLGTAAPGGLSAAERADLTAVAREVSREDLRERLGRLLAEGGDAAAREAEQAVQAVLDAADGVAGEGAEGGAETPGAVADGRPGVGRTGPGGTEGEETLAHLTGADMNGLNGDRAPNGGDASDFPGIEPGDELAEDEAGDWTRTPGPEDPTMVRGDEGDVRAYLVAGVPGETPPGPAVAAAALSPQDVELLLRQRGIPPEVRDLVRRYFELTGGNP